MYKVWAVRNGDQKEIQVTIPHLASTQDQLSLDPGSNVDTLQEGCVAPVIRSKLSRIAAGRNSQKECKLCDSKNSILVVHLWELPNSSLEEG